MKKRKERERRERWKKWQEGLFFFFVVLQAVLFRYERWGTNVSRIVFGERQLFDSAIFCFVFVFLGFQSSGASERSSAAATPRPCQRWPPWPAPPACRRTPRGSRTARHLGAGPRTPAGAARPARAAQPLPGRRDASSRGRRRLQRRGQEEKKGRPGLLLLPTRLKGPRARRRRGKGTRLSPRGCA